MRGEVIEKAYGGSLRAHKSPDRPYLVEKISRNDPSEVIISFSGSGAVKDWYSQRNFGETKIDLTLFPSLRSIGSDEPALVNETFLKRFQGIILLPRPSLADEVLLCKTLLLDFLVLLDFATVTKFLHLLVM